MSTDVASNLEQVRNRLEQACVKANRPVESVKLLAVSKTKPPEMLMTAYEMGVRDFGENYVQDWLDKEGKLPKDIRWHFIGHLQRNKVKKVVGHSFLLHSVDSLRLLEELDKKSEALGIKTACLIEVNVGGEESKSGCEEVELNEILERSKKLENIDLRGLMSIPPFLDDPEEIRPYHVKLRKLRDRAQTTFGLTLPELSMGMSFDMEVAIEEGATIVRVGTDIFGARIK